MGILETSQKVVKLANAVANPEFIEAAIEANIEAFELRSANLELQKRVMQLEKDVEELNAKLTLDGRTRKAGCTSER